MNCKENLNESTVKKSLSDSTICKDRLDNVHNKVDPGLKGKEAKKLRERPTSINTKNSILKPYYDTADVRKSTKFVEHHNSINNNNINNKKPTDLDFVNIR